MTNEPVKILKTLKFGHGADQKVWLEGEIVYPPLPAEIQGELKKGSIFCVEIGKEPRPKFDRGVLKHFTPDLPPVDPILEDVKRKTEERVKQEAAKDQTQTTVGVASHTSVPEKVVGLKRRKL